MVGAESDHRLYLQVRNTDFRLVLLHALRFGNGVSSGRKKLRGSEIEDCWSAIPEEGAGSIGCMLVMLSELEAIIGLFLNEGLGLWA